MRKTLSFITASMLLAGPAMSQSAEDLANVVEARHGYMLMLSMKLATLGGMAKGDIAYDAAVAGAAGKDLAALASIDTTMLWVPGTENGVAEDSAALPDIFTNADDRNTKFNNLKVAADAMAEASGKDLDSLKAAMGGLGGACSECHKLYRKSEN